MQAISILKIYYHSIHLYFINSLYLALILSLTHLQTISSYYYYSNLFLLANKHLFLFIIVSFLLNFIQILPHFQLKLDYYSNLAILIMNFNLKFAIFLCYQLITIIIMLNLNLINQSKLDFNYSQLLKDKNFKYEASNYY